MAGGPLDFRNFEREGWNRPGKADEYDDHFARLTAPFANQLIDVLGVGPGTRVLDLGCGPGHMAAAAAATGASVTGLDFSPAMIRRAVAGHPGITFIVGDAEDPPFPPRSYDAISAGFLLQHLASPEKALAAWRRLLASGGRLGLCNWVFGPRPTPSPQTVFRMALADAGVEPAPSPPGSPDFTGYDSPGTMADFLHTAGFGDVSHTEVAHPVRFTADEIWDAMAKGSVRVAALIDGQGPEVRARVMEALRARVALEPTISLNASTTTAVARP